MRLNLATSNGLRLGLTRAQVETMIGPASTAGDGWYERACFSEKRMTAEQLERPGAQAYPFFTISSVVRVVEKAGKAVGIEITWAETY